jgi:hypothetical protein
MTSNKYYQLHNDRETSLSRTNISLRGYNLLAYEKIIENIKRSLFIFSNKLIKSRTDVENSMIFF